MMNNPGRSGRGPALLLAVGFSEKQSVQADGLRCSADLEVCDTLQAGSLRYEASRFFNTPQLT